MKIELDTLINILGKIEDAQNLTAIQEGNLLQIENAAIRYHVAKTDEDKASRITELGTTASADGSSAASLNRASSTVLASLCECVEGLIAEASNNQEAAHE